MKWEGWMKNFLICMIENENLDVNGMMKKCWDLNGMMEKCLDLRRMMRGLEIGGDLNRRMGRK